ncbi:DoxX family protein [Paenibacillus tarimensis]
MKWVIRIIQGLLVVGFILFGTMKLTGNEMLVQTFTALGYSTGFMYFLGVCEVLGAIGLLVGFWRPILAMLASVGLILLLAGAVFSHLKAGQGMGEAMPAFVLLILTLVLVIGNRAQLKRRANV